LNERFEVVTICYQEIIDNKLVAPLADEEFLEGARLGARGFWGVNVEAALVFSTFGRERRRGDVEFTPISCLLRRHELAP